MTDPLAIVVTAIAGLAAISILATAGLKGWRDWITLQQAALGQNRSGADITGTGTRIELADLRERVRKLEAIAAGVDL